jgi:hypothetical protein
MSARRRPKVTRAPAAPKCSVCASTSREKIERSFQRGESAAVIATRYGVSRSAATRHRADHMGAPASRDSSSPAMAEPPPPVVVTQARPVDASPLDRARLNADEALAALQQGEGRGLPPADLARLRNALTNAEKFYAQLASSRQLTPEAIVRTAGWAALVAEIDQALKPYPDAARAVLAAMRQ